MTYTADQMLEMINKSDEVCCSALVQLYYRQTEDEKETAQTTHSNKQGFNALDAAILSSFAEQVIANRKLREEGRFEYKILLSRKQLELARVKIRKYVRQLVEIACEKAEARAAKEVAPVAQTYEAYFPSALVVEGNNIRWKTAEEMLQATGPLQLKASA